MKPLTHSKRVLHHSERAKIDMIKTAAVMVLATSTVLAGCLSDEQAGMPALAPAARAPATCADALYNVVQAEKAYDEFLAGADQVREAVLAANRLCGQ